MTGYLYILIKVCFFPDKTQKHYIKPQKTPFK